VHDGVAANELGGSQDIAASVSEAGLGLSVSQMIAGSLGTVLVGAVGRSAE
jgi:hypothetical protein